MTPEMLERIPATTFAAAVHEPLIDGDVAEAAPRRAGREAALVVEHCTKRFPLPKSERRANGNSGGQFCVFRDVSLEIFRGEFVSMIGHSGCGKSTLLNIIAGFDRASEGRILVAGKPVAGPGLDRMVVFQNFALMPWLTAFNNVKVAVRSAHPDWDDIQVQQHTQKYLDMMGLKDAGPKLPAYLSGGMRQRVGLARAFAVDPKVLLLDEPFAQIDALTRGIIQDELMRMWSTVGATIFMVTHDVDEAILLSDRIALMSNGPDARLAELVEVNIARPRTRQNLIGSEEYTRLRHRILRFLIENAAHA